MMEITKLTNNRIYYEENKFYRSNIDITIMFALKKGMKLEEDAEKQLLLEIILFRSYGFLARKDYTEKEMKAKLLMEFPKSSPINEVIEKLKENSYIDDFAYAKNYISLKKLSRKRIYFDLMTKGIKKEYIDESLESSEIDEKKMISVQLKKLEGKDERKKVEYLLRKGYNIKDILELIKEIKKETGGSHD